MLKNIKRDKKEEKNFLKNIRSVLEESIRVVNRGYTTFSNKLNYLLMKSDYKTINNYLKLNSNNNEFTEHMISYLSSRKKDEFERLIENTKYLEILLEKINNEMENKEILKEKSNEIAKIIANMGRVKKRGKPKKVKEWYKERVKMLKIFKKFIRHYKNSIEDEIIEEIINNYKNRYIKDKNFSAYVAIEYLKENILDSAKSKRVLKIASELREVRGLYWFTITKLIKKSLPFSYEEDRKEFYKKWMDSRKDDDKDFARFIEFYYKKQLMGEPSFTGHYDNLLEMVIKEIEERGRIKSFKVWGEIFSFILSGIKNNAFTEGIIDRYISLFLFDLNSKDLDKDSCKLFLISLYSEKIKRGEVSKYEDVIKIMAESYDISDVQIKGKIYMEFNKTINKLIEEKYLLHYISKGSFEKMVENWKERGDEEDRELIRTNRFKINEIMNSFQI